MARAVDAWLYRKCLRDYGPRDMGMQALLHTIAAFVGNDSGGEAYPSQEKLAEYVGASVRTVRSKIQEASKQHWIGIYAGAAAGKQWARFTYRLCIPDWVELSEEEENRADAFMAIWGEVSGAALFGGPFTGTKGPARVAAPSAAILAGVTEGPAIDAQRDRQITHEGPATDDTRTGTSCRESSPLKVLQKVFPDRSAAGAATGFSEDEVTPREAQAGGGLAKVRKLLQRQPDFSNHDVAKVTGEPIELVQRVREEMQ